MDPRKQDAQQDFEPPVGNFPTLDPNIVEQWSQQFMLTDIERSAAIERLSQHVVNQENMIYELRKNRNELMLDGLQIDEKIDEEKELFEVAVNLARGNEDLLKKVQNMTCLARKSLGDFHNFEKVAKGLNEAKMAKVSEHREKLSELKGLFVALENKRAKYCEMMSQEHATSVQSAEENSTKVDEAKSEAKAVLQQLIDSKQLTGLDLSGALSITQQLQKSVEFSAKKNDKLKKIITAQKEKKRLFNEATAQFSKEIERNAKVEEISHLDIDQLFAVEKLLMEERKQVEDDLAEREKILNRNRGDVEGKKLQITRLELAVANNETCVDGMRRKMGQEHDASEARKQELEKSLSVIKEQLMAEKLEGLFMKGRLQEVQNQVEQSRESSQYKLTALESEVETYENAYKTTVQQCSDEEKILQKGIDQANCSISQLMAEKLTKEKEIEAEKTSLMKISNQIDRLNSEAKTLKVSNQAAAEELEIQVSEFQNTQTEIDSLKKKREHLSLVYVKMEQYEKEFKDVERARGDTETLWIQIRDIEENQRVQEMELDKQLQELKTDSKQMQNEIIIVEASNQKKQNEFEMLNREVLKFKDRINQINEQLVEHQQALMQSQKRKQVRAKAVKVEQKPRERLPTTRANAAAKSSEWEALIRDCVPVKQEKTELVPFVVPALQPPKRAKKFFTSRQSTMVASSNCSTQEMREKSCDVFDYESDDDVQFLAQVTRRRRRR